MKRPSSRIRLLVLLLATIGGYGIASFPELFVRYGDAPCEADLIVVPGGDNGERTLKAAELYHTSPSATILLMGYDHGLLGAGTYRAEWQTNWLSERHIPISALSYDTTALGTWDEAEAALEMAQTMQARTVLVVTDPTHVFRCRTTYTHIFDGSGIGVRIIATHPTWWRAEKWWSNHIAAANVLAELPKLLVYFFRVLGSW